MARKHRVQYEGAIYHLTNRGGRGEPIFRTDADRKLFLTCLDQCCARTGWQVHAYVLMPDHFHLVVETPQPNLADGMKWFLGTYTNRFNRRHDLFGHLFSGRYKSLIVDGSGDGYLKTVCDYVHLNPARAKLVGPRTALSRFVWSSWPDYLKAPSKRPEWLRVDRLMDGHGIPTNSTAGQRKLERRVEAQRATDNDEEYKPIRRGWCLGGDGFRQDLLKQMSAGTGAKLQGGQRREVEAARAERIVEIELRKARWKEERLASTPGGHPVKVRVAVRLRKETTVTYEWIAKRLHMGTRSNASSLVYAQRRK